MSANINVFDPNKLKKVLMVAANPAISKQTGWPIGFWAAELTHPYFEFTEKGYQVEIVSPHGGKLQIDSFSDPRDASDYSAHDLISWGFLSSPQHAALLENTKSLAQVKNKVIIDATNSVFQKPEPYAHGVEAFKALTNCDDVVKCFNSTGFENMANPKYGDLNVDMLVASSSQKGKNVAKQLAKDLGFAECYDFGGDDKIALLEQFALAWINLAIMQKHGRGMAFKILKR